MYYLYHHKGAYAVTILHVDASSQQKLSPFMHLEILVLFKRNHT